MLELKTSKCFNLATTVILAVQSAWELSHPVSNYGMYVSCGCYLVHFHVIQFL